MDVKIFHNLIDALKVAGCSINEDFIPILYNSLIQLQSENHFDSIYLWGRIVTLSNDYYIAYGYQNDPIKNRIFFYTQNILEWDIMPTDWTTLESNLVNKVKNKFYGNPRHVEIADFKKKSNVVEHSTEPSEMLHEEYAEGEEEEHKNIKRLNSSIINDIISIDGTEETMISESILMGTRTKEMIKEENRLAITVKMIENEGHIVPRGYFYKLPDGNVVKAPYFKGLDYSEIGNEQNFLHINPYYCSPKDTKNKSRPNYNGSIDFLEPIDKDLPKGCWTPRIVSNRYLIVHNLLWPGAIFVQDMNTGVHGFFYNGDGIKNFDLVFMI